MLRIFVSECRIEELTDKLVKREGEAFEGLIESVNLSTALNKAIEKQVLFLCSRIHI